MVRGAGQGQGLEAGDDTCALGHRWLCPGWRGPAGAVGPRELRLPAEAGPRLGGPSTEAGQDLMEGSGVMRGNSQALQAGFLEEEVQHEP